MLQRHCLLCLLLLLCMNGSNAVNNTSTEILYGACFQKSTNESTTVQMVLWNEIDPIMWKHYGFDDSVAKPIDCVWCDSNKNAFAVSAMNASELDKLFATPHIQQKVNVQNASNQTGIKCFDHTIHIQQNSNAISRHLCSNFCASNLNVSCLDSDTFQQATLKNIPSSFQRVQHSIEPLIPSMLVVLAVSASFAVVCFVVYCVNVKYHQWSEQKTGNETEQVIEDVFDEIAKYAIAGDDDDGDRDSLLDYDSEEPDSSHSSEEEALGMAILKVISTQNLLPGLSQSYLPSLSVLDDDDDESDKDGETETLQTNLALPVLPNCGGSNDCKQSSDACTSNSDLP